LERPAPDIIAAMLGIDPQGFGYQPDEGAEEGLLGVLRKCGAEARAGLLLGEEFGDGPPGGPRAALGEDNGEVLARAKEAMAGRSILKSSPLTSEAGLGALEAARRRAREALKEKQVDLSLGILPNLEDEGLVAHMRHARKTMVAESPRFGQARPAAGKDQHSRDQSIRRCLSSIATGLHATLQSLRCAHESVALQEANIGRIMNGETPHGYPQREELMLGHLAKKVGEAGGAVEATVSELSELEGMMTLLRREYELFAAPTGN
jgi:hypothetical protein